MTPPAAVLPAEPAPADITTPSTAPVPDAMAACVSTLRISGMYCAACAGVVEAALQQVDGVVEARVSAAA